MKKLLALVLVGVMSFGLVACGSTEAAAPAAEAETAEETTEEAATEEAAEETEEAAEETAAETTGDTFTIGVCQLVQHPALDAATEGFETALKDQLGDAVTFDEQNAQGDSNTCATIVNSFVSSSYDLILANATAPLQAAAAATDSIPVLGTSITDYATALEITDWTGTVGTNVSGTSDLAPLDQQAAMIQELFPEAKTIGLLYCSAEPNSQYQVDVIEGYLTDMGYECTQYGFSDSNDLASVCTTANDSSDVIYIPTDNTAASNTELINNICYGSTPVVAGEEGICAGCGIATLSISYYDLGYTTGQMAAKILTGSADVATMPVEFAPNVVKKYNAANAEALGITLPEGYEAIETE